MRAAGRRVALVPTMGALHEGHLSLVQAGYRLADRVVVSIFVNPTQFGPTEDFARYPRDLARDLESLRKVGADVVFTPSVEEIYPNGDATWVTVDRLTSGLCGRNRPGHFRGVTTVVARLLHAARPHVAIFGEKDYQQLAVIRRMARDLCFGVEIVGDAATVCATARQRIEKEPLAEIDYVELVDAESLEPVREVGARALLALAVRFEGTRLIDNTILELV